MEKIEQYYNISPWGDIEEIDNIYPWYYMEK